MKFIWNYPLVSGLRQKCGFADFLRLALLAKSCSLLKQEAKYFKIKLTNKGSACLTLEMEFVSSSKAIFPLFN